MFYTFSDLGTISSQIHVFVEGERLDQLAYQYYQKPGLWWVIAEFNPKIKDPMNIAPGTELRIPNV
jgi:hypothetical protein